MKLNLDNLVFIDLEYNHNTITEAGIIAGELELSFKVSSSNSQGVQYCRDGTLIISPQVLAQNIYILCKGKTIVHYGGSEVQLITNILRGINNYNDKGEITFLDLQYFVRKSTGVPEVPTLTELGQVLGIKEFQAHNALEDARAARDCLIKIHDNTSYYTPMLREYMYNRTKEAILKPALDRLDKLNKFYPEYDSIKVYQTHLKPIETCTVFSR